MTVAKHKITDWLPITKKELKKHGWEELDVVLFTGDAYVDHPAFGAAVIGRVLQSEGLRVAIVPQPNWQDDLRDFKKMGVPKMFFAVTSGNMDSMVNHYTAAKRLRSNDAYTAGGRAGQRPDYATTKYCNILKEIYPNIPILIGGIEASLRRFTHFDYWSNKLKKSILIESKADLLAYGMGEKVIRQLISMLKKGIPFKEIKNLPQTAFITDRKTFKAEEKDLELYSHEECLADKLKFADNFKTIEIQSNKIAADNRIIQPTKEGIIVVNAPFYSDLDKELDRTHALPFTRLPHPKYNNKGSIPAYEMIKFSVNSHRGCFGGCSFCTISAHQGKSIVSRSEKSIMTEIDEIAKLPDFKGNLSDLGGPSSNMYKMKGKNIKMCEKCQRPSCIFPNICSNLNSNHSAITELYRKVSAQKNVKRLFIGSGMRYDLLFDKNGKISEKDKKEYFEQLVKHHVSGRLKVAPEHISHSVLQIMRKYDFNLFKELKKEFDLINKKNNLKQQIIPYFIGAHPACRNEDMAELAAETKNLNFRLEQVQDFTPTPMTLSTVIFYTGINPYTKKKVYTAKNIKDKKEQLSFLFWYKKEHRRKIMNVLKKAKEKI